MPQAFADQVAVITGSSRGIGFATAQHLVSAGARVCLTGRDEETLAQAAETLGGPQQAIFVAGKADDPEHQAQTISTTIETFGPIDVLVNNVGINPAYGPLAQVDQAVARKTFEVNALAPLRWTQQVHASGMGQRGGVVINVSSLAGSTVAIGLGMYGATKAMLEHMTRQLAYEMGPLMRVNAVAPAIVKTRFAEKLYEAGEEVTAARFPLRRLGTPDDIARAVAFLASPEAKWITGQVLIIDGGLSLGQPG